MSEKKINNIEDIFKNFDDIIGDNKSPFSNKKSSVKSNRHLKFEAASSIKTGGLIGFGILIVVLAIGIPAIIEHKFSHLKNLAPILKLVIGGFGVFFSIKFSNRPIVVVELFKNHMTVMQDNPVGGSIRNFLYFIKLMRNKFTKVNIPLNCINSITRDKSFFSNGVIVINGQDKNKAFNFPTAMTMIDQKNLDKLINILKEDGIQNIYI